MYKFLFDWYKVVDLHPDEAMLEKRKLIIDEIIKLITSQSNRHALASCIAGIVAGFEILPEDTSFTKDIITLHQTHLLSFSSHLSENGLELRVACAIALGEILNQGIESNRSSSNKLALLGSALLLSTLGLANHQTGKYLIEMIKQLEKVGMDVSEANAEKLRTRQPINFLPPQEIEFPLTEASFTKVMTEIQKAFKKVEQDSLVNREELEILWWYQKGISTSLQQPLVKLSAANAAIRAGIEVAERIIIPPLESTTSTIRLAVEKERKSNTLSPKTIGEFVKSIEIDGWTLLVPSDNPSRLLVETFPSLLPFSWLGMRLKESKGATDPTTEFEQRTQISTGKTISPADFAVLIFREQVAKQIYRDCLKEKV